MTTADAAQPTLYDQVGGHATFERLIGHFFDGVKSDPDLLAMYQHDLPGSQERLRMFFEQYWGGPMAYSQTRGAPRLKMRHIPFKVTPRMRDHWAHHMHRAITLTELPPDADLALRAYVERAADFLINADDEDAAKR